MPLETRVHDCAKREDAPQEGDRKRKMIERGNEWMGMEQGNGRLVPGV
jgi:hypothetical protein